MFIIILSLIFIMSNTFASSKIINNSRLENDKINSNIQKIDISSKYIENSQNDIWNKTYGGNSYDTGDFVQQTNDNGFIIAGCTCSFGAGDWDVWLIKTDENGDMQWNKTFGGIYEDISSCVRQTSDGGYVIVGYSESDNGGIYDAWLIKTDINGTLEWDKKFRGPTYLSAAEDVIILDDGYLIMATIYGDYNDIWLIKTDSDGNEIWDEKVGGISGDDRGNSVIKTRDGDYLIVGGWRFENAILIKTDSNGNRLWRKTYDGSVGFGVFETDDNCYMICAGMGSNAYIIKTDSNGEELWTKYYQTRGNYWCWSFAQTSDKGYVVSGGTDAYPNEADVFLFKIDENGDKFWEMTIGGDERDGANCVIESNDGNYVIIGETASFGAGGWDAWLIKMPTFENQRPNKPSKPIGPTRVKPYNSYNYTTNSTDSDGDIFYFKFICDDDSESFWYGPYNNNETCVVKYYFGKSGTFDIKVKAKDICGGVSDWSEPLTITISKDKSTNNMLFLRILVRFPLLQKLIFLIN